MSFIIVFNICVCVIAAVILLVLLASSVISRDLKKKGDEKAVQALSKVERVRSFSYLVFFCVLILMVMVNLIF